jgi:nucleotide-binding universal stress UspA family protein
MQRRTILVAIDYSPHAAESRRWGVSLAQRYRARVLLLHVLATVGEETTPLERSPRPVASGTAFRGSCWGWRGHSWRPTSWAGSKRSSGCR